MTLLFACASAWAQKPELAVQTGHSLAVDAVTFSPDGKLLASAGHDDAIKLWDAATGTELRTLKGHGTFLFSLASGFKNSVVFSPDSRTLATGSQDYTLKLWDVATGGLRLLKGHKGYVNAVAFSHDGKTLASVGDTTIRLWDFATGAHLRTIKTNSFMLYSVAFSPDGRTLASGSQDYENADQTALGGGVATLWDIASGARLRILKSGWGDVRTTVFSPDGKTLATGSADSTITLWDVATGVALRTLDKWPRVPGQSMSRPLAFVNSAAFSPDGTALVSGSYDETVALWDVASGSVLRYFRGHSSSVTSVAFGHDGKTLASGSDDHTIKLWDVVTGLELRTLEGHSSPTSVAFSPDGKTLADESGKDIARLWDISTGTMRTHERSAPAYSGEFSPDGKTLARIGDNAIQLIEVTTGKELRKIRPSSHTYSIAFSPDSRILASGSNMGGPIELWDVSSGAQLPALAGDSIDLIRFTFSPDSKTLAGDGGKIIKLWDVATGAALRTLINPVAASGYNIFRPVVFSRDGKTIASGNDDGTIRVWDVGTGTELRTLKGHAGYVTAIAFSLDNKYLVSGSFDSTIKVWEFGSGKEVASLIALDERDWIVVTPDGLFDGSPSAWNKILWRFNDNTFDHAPVEAFFSEFYYPGLLTDIFAGRNPKPPSDISQKDRRQPDLKLALAGAQSDARLAAREVKLKIDVAEITADTVQTTGSGAQDVRLFRNGSLVKVWSGDVLKGKSSVTLETTIPIVAGENKLTAYAFNHDNIKSSDATLVVNGADSLKRQGTAYILAIGVNKYSNDQYNLNYAVPDAQDFAAEIKRQQESLKRYAQVEVISLADAQATKANITRKLIDLSTRVQPEDAVIVFFAGHGTAHGNQFYLMPHDLGYRGRRDRLSRVGLQTILRHSISDRDLEKLFEGIDAGQLLLVIDACNSGQALEAEEKRRGPMNSKGLAQLAYEKGMYVMTAAQSYQAAMEAAKFGHGYLTYALIEEGLKKGAADREPRNGTIDIREWLNFATDEVPKMQEQTSLDALRSRKRYVVFVGDGRQGGIPKSEADARDNIQRPRVFYRRELETNPFVVAVTGAAPPR